MIVGALGKLLEATEGIYLTKYPIWPVCAIIFADELWRLGELCVINLLLPLAGFFPALSTFAKGEKPRFLRGCCRKTGCCLLERRWLASTCFWYANTAIMNVTRSVK
jgi:hypothetical protein